MCSRMKIERIDMADTKIPVGDADKSTEKIGSNVIECSVNMNLSLSNAKRSKIFQRTQTLLILILAILFAIVCSHLKREVRALEVQMSCVNSNLMMLMLRYDKLNQNFNRIWYHQRHPHHHHHHRVGFEAIATTGQFNGADFDKLQFSNGQIASSTAKVAKAISERNATNDRKKVSNESVGNNIEDGIILEKSGLIGDPAVQEAQVSESADRDRYERAVFAFETRNHEITTAMPASLRGDSNDDTNPWSESRAGRSRRDEGRGKKRRKIKRRLKRSRRRLGPLVATFVGAVPEQHVTDAVYVGPWVKSTRNESQYAFNKFHLVEDKTSIEVTANGLYMISAQIYYFGEPTHYSYWILLSSEGTSRTRKVIKCATVSAVSASEASCYTSVVLPLRRGDRIHIQQQERDRLINLREGHSYVQIMLLSSESARRRGS